MTIANLKDSSCILMPQYTCAVNQVTDLLLKAVFFLGEEELEFGSLKGKSMIALSVKISF